MTVQEIPAVEQNSEDLGTEPNGSKATESPQGRSGRFVGRFAGRFVALLVLLPLLGAALGLTLALFLPTSYTAHSYVILIAEDGSDGSATDSAQATARVATKTSVLQSAGADAALIRAAEDGKLTATASPDAPLVDLAASAPTAAESERLANELASAAETQVNNFSSATGVSARVYARASLPLDPTLPNFPVSILTGAALGVLASAVLFVLRRPGSKDSEGRGAETTAD